ncbi:MAG: HAMP domain-containing histidine kinase [Proteobacteria bacterium]|nr:HAMP domain-containing histidine kinase [Pseudomonadota bacterium]
MRPGKLYIKIFLSFLAFLVVAEIAIFGFFAFFAGRKYHDYYLRYNDSRLMMAKELIEDGIRKWPGRSVADNPALAELVPRLGMVFRARIWLTSSDGSIVFKSFEDNIPDYLVKKYRQDADDTSRYHFKYTYRKHHKWYLTDSVTADGKTVATLHMLHRDRIASPPGPGFAIGLLGIGVAIALLIIPVSRQISRPIKNLTSSARKIEQGDLSHRASVKSKDEIGELGKAFNHMADKLESMIRSGKELTAQISHELRSPLTRIQVAVELIKDRLEGADDGETVEHLHEIREDVEELDHLIGRILELSKLDIQESVPYSETFSPAELLEEIVKKFEPVMAGKEIALSLDTSVRDSISGNREAFVTVLSNLVDNACKFAPPKGTLTVSTRLESDSLRVVVANSCSALSEEELSRIFEPFYRTDPITKNGIGLGLAIVRKIVEQHRGTISAVNTPAGLEMRIDIPLSA